MFLLLNLYILLPQINIMVDSLTYMFYFVVIGMLCGIIWSLKYIVRIERRIENIEGNIDRLLGKMEKEIEKEEKEIKKIEESEGVLDESLDERIDKI